MATQESIKYKEFVKWATKNKPTELPLTGNQAQFIDEFIDFIEYNSKAKELIIGIGNRNNCFWLVAEWYKYQNRQVF